MLKGFTHARLACGCRIAFREGVEGSPVTVIVDQKSPACSLTLHVRDLPLFDYREALRPSTRLRPTEEEEFEEEGETSAHPFGRAAGRARGRALPDAARNCTAFPLKTPAVRMLQR